MCLQEFNDDVHPSIHINVNQDFTSWLSVTVVADQSNLDMELSAADCAQWLGRGASQNKFCCQY